MSDVMLFGVLRMPYEMAMSDELSRFQFWQRAQEAANQLEAAERTPAEPAPASTGREAELMALLRTLVAGDAGQTVLYKLSTGQSTNTHDGRAWLAAKALVDGVPVAACELDVEAERLAPLKHRAMMLDKRFEWRRLGDDGEWEAYWWPLFVKDEYEAQAWLDGRGQRLQWRVAEAAQVSTEQAGDAREQVQHVTWMVGRRVGRTHALAQQIIDNLSDEAKARTSYGNIRDVLDAVHKMNRSPSPNNSPVGADRRE